jgi:hypothetical protein
VRCGGYERCGERGERRVCGECIGKRIGGEMVVARQAPYPEGVRHEPFPSSFPFSRAGLVRVDLIWMRTEL